MTTMTPAERAASWWADRLTAEFGSKRVAFKVALTYILEQQRQQLPWDYLYLATTPFTCTLLLDAAARAGIPDPGQQDLFDQVSTMCIYPDGSIKGGHGLFPHLRPI